MATESLFEPCKYCGKSISTSAKRCPNCGKVLWRMAAWHWVVLVLVALAFLGSFNESANSPPRSASTNKAELKDRVTLEFSWSKTAFDSVMEADFAIQNNNAVDVKDVQIKCVHFAKSGTQMDSNERTIFEIIRSGERKVYPDFNMGFIHTQAVESNCRIEKVSKAS